MSDSQVEVRFIADTAGLEGGAQRASASFQSFADRVRAGASGAGELDAMLGRLRLSLGANTAAVDDLTKRLDTLKVAARSAGSGLSDIGRSAHGAQAGMGGITREMLVVGRELANGNYTRLGGSLTILAQKFGALSFILTPLGGALTVAAVGAGALAFAMHQGAEDQIKFTNALQATNNWAGLSESQLHTFAETLGEQTHSGAGKARDALLEVVQSGVFADKNLQIVTRTALDLAHAFGGEASTYIKQFSGLQTNTVETTYKLQQQFHMLTPEMFNHIIALTKAADATGDYAKRQEAISLVMSKLDGQMKNQTQNLGYAETAWRGVTDAISKAVEALMAWGRAPDTSTRLKTEQEKLIQLQEQASSHSGRTAQAAQAQLAAQQGIVSALQKQLQTEQQQIAASAKLHSDSGKIDKAYQAYKNQRRPKKPTGVMGSLDEGLADESRKEMQAANGKYINLEALAKAYWEIILAGVTLSKDQRIAVEKKLADAEIALAKQAAGEKAKQSAFEASEAAKDAQAQLRTQQKATQDGIAEAERLYKAKIIKAQQALATIQGYLNQEAHAEIEAAKKERDAQLADAGDKMSNAPDTTQYADGLREKEAATREFASQVSTILATLNEKWKSSTEKTTDDVLSRFKKMTDGMSKAFAQTASDLIMKKTTWAKVFSSLEGQVLDAVIQSGAKQVAAFAMGQLQKLMLQKSAAVAGAATEKASGAVTIQSDAGKAAAGAYAAVSQLPFVGWLLAPGAAAAAYAATMAFSAEGGWGEVPYDGAPTVLHKQEMVLPAKFANPLRSLLGGASLPSLNQAQLAASPLSAVSPAFGGGGGTTNLAIHATDAKSFRRLLSEHSDHIAREVSKATRNNRTAFA